MWPNSLRPELENIAVGRRHASLANVSADPAGIPGHMAQLTHGLLVAKSKTHCGPVENPAVMGAGG